MAIKQPLQMSGGDHGQRPYGYRIEVAKEPKRGQYVDPFGTRLLPPNPVPPESFAWAPRLGVLHSVQAGYGSQPPQANFVMWDPDHTLVQSSDADLTRGQMTVPVNEDLVRITLYTQAAPGGVTIFQGSVKNVHRRVSDQGVEYAVDAVSEVARLNEVGVTFTCNLRNDPINPSPRFDGFGRQFYAKLLTVREIVRNIMEFRDAWGNDPFFTYDDIDWGDLENDLRCGLYVPGQLTFDGTPKGQAIEEVLQRAGNFTFLYVPAAGDGRGKIRVVELNLACNRCGPMLPLTYATPEAIAAAGGLYASDNNVIEDLTQWSSVDACNTVRVVSGPIRFYSGNYMIPEVLAGASGNNAVQVENDLPADQLLRAVSPDNCNYRFRFPRLTTVDTRATKQFPVGMPLFPDWNVHEDFLPATTQILDVVMPPGIDTGDDTGNLRADNYQGIYEYERFTVGDQCARGEMRIGHQDNLHVYQAWYTDGPCPACQGSGLVAAVYAGGDPTLEMVGVKPDGTTRVLPHGQAAPDELVRVRVTNYILDPALFGTGAQVPAGLTPFDATSGYPVPWRNLCPYCRGVGANPVRKIRNIQGDLFAGRNNKAIPSSTSAPEIPIDPDATQTGPESFSDTVNRIVIRQEPQVQVEYPVMNTTLPNFDLRNNTFEALRDAPAGTQRYRFPHPLSFSTVTRNIPTLYGPTGDVRDLTAEDWSAEVPFTTVMVQQVPEYRVDYEMGRVIFLEPLFVPCRKEFTTYARVDNGRFLVNEDGTLRERSPGRGLVTADRFDRPTGYWRPARVWMTCFYGKQNYFDYLYDDGAATNPRPVPTVQFTATNADGEQGTYTSRAMVLDGRLAIEIQKLNPSADEAGGTLFDTGNRVLQKVVDFSSGWVETTEGDLFKYPVPTKTDMTQSDLEADKRLKHCDFPRGRLLRYERTTPGEVMLEMAGYVAEDYKNTLMRPKLFSFGLRDNRTLMLTHGVKTLEASNNLRVEGSVTAVDVVEPMNSGLGYTSYPGRGNAAVVRVEWDFTNGMDVRLELTRAQAREGETIPNDQDLMNDLQKQVVEMRRVLATGGYNNSGGSGNMEQDAGDAPFLFYRGG